MARTVALAVPSAVVPPERNWVLNPAHPRAAGIRVLAETPFRFDERMGA